MLARDSCGLEVFIVHRGRVEKEAGVSGAVVELMESWRMRVTHMGAWKGCWGWSLVVVPAHGNVAPARSCPHQLHLSPSFGPLQLKAVLSFEEARASLPDGEGEGDVAGEAHHAQAGQPHISQACTPVHLLVYLHVSTVLCLELLSLTPYGWARSPHTQQRRSGVMVVSSPISQGSSGALSAVPAHPCPACPALWLCPSCPQ